MSAPSMNGAAAQCQHDRLHLGSARSRLVMHFENAAPRTAALRALTEGC